MKYHIIFMGLCFIHLVQAMNSDEVITMPFSRTRMSSGKINSEDASPKEYDNLQAVQQFCMQNPQFDFDYVKEQMHVLPNVFVEEHRLTYGNNDDPSTQAIIDNNILQRMIKMKRENNDEYVKYVWNVLNKYRPTHEDVVSGAMDTMKRNKNIDAFVLPEDPVKPLEPVAGMLITDLAEDNKKKKRNETIYQIALGVLTTVLVPILVPLIQAYVPGGSASAPQAYFNCTGLH